MGYRLLIKDRVGECEMERRQIVEHYETAKREMQEWGPKIWETKNQRYAKTVQNRATTWLGTRRATLLLPPTTSSCSFFLLPLSFLPPPSPRLSGTGTSLPSHYHSIPGTPAVDAAVNSHNPGSPPYPSSSAELGWSRLYLTLRRSSLHLLCGDGQKGVGGGQRRGEHMVC